MRVVVIGGTGRIGSKVVSHLRDAGHEAVAASPSTGVDAYSGAGLADALAGADTVVDVADSPRYGDEEVLDFFTTSTRRMLEAEQVAGIGHHVVLSIVGADRLPDGSYYRAKVAQEELVRDSGAPFGIVRATQFYEFAKGMADSAEVDGVVREPHRLIQPMAADDAGERIAEVAVGAPLNSTVEIGGPEIVPIDRFVRVALAALGDGREVVTDSDAPYFGARLEERSLLPGPDAWLSTLTFEEWSARQR